MPGLMLEILWLVFIIRDNGRMGSWTPQLCFSVFTSAEERLYVSAEEI